MFNYVQIVIRTMINLDFLLYPIVINETWIKNWNYCE